MKSAAQPVSCKSTVMWHEAICLAEGRWEGSGGKNLKQGRLLLFFFFKGGGMEFHFLGFVVFSDSINTL